MTLYIPSEITNIILEYYAQLANLKWQPFIHQKTGKLKWKVNKYSTKYDYINKLIEHKKDNLVRNISIDVSQVMGSEIINAYFTRGTCICLKIENRVSQCHLIYPISEIYINFNDDHGYKNSLFCSIIKKSTLCKSNYDIYQDGNIYSILKDLHSFDDISFTLIIEKY